MINHLERSGIQGIHLSIIKAIYSKPTVNIKLSREKLKGIPLKSGIKPGCPFLPYLFIIDLDVLARSIRKQRIIKGIQIGKKDIRLSLFTDNMIVFISVPKNSTRELLQLINTNSNVAGNKINQKKRKKEKESATLLKTVKWLKMISVENDPL